MHLLQRFVGAALFAVVLAPVAQATTLAPLTVEQMTDASDLVVRGTVEAMWAEVNARGHVQTHVRVSVTEDVKGEADVGQVLDVTSPGGVLDDGRVYNVDLAARYSVGEDVLLFLGAHRDGTYGTVAMSLGKYTVRQNPADGLHMVVRFTVPYDVAYDARFVPAPAVDARQSLTTFLDRVRDRVELGWDGQPIPGASPSHLREINRLQPGVK